MPSLTQMGCISVCSQPKRFTGFENLHFAHCSLKLVGAVQCSFGGKATFNGWPLPSSFYQAISGVLYLYLHTVVFVFAQFGIRIRKIWFLEAPKNLPDEKSVNIFCDIPRKCVIISTYQKST